MREINIYIYIYIERERQRGTERQGHKDTERAVNDRTKLTLRRNVRRTVHFYVS